ncbi:MAG: dTMP kinase [Patescibacteria group bacterium]|nr:dTMP kinase [Patescibacteria group bacterium]
MVGKFIVFEGGEKSGKSTQIKLLADYLQKQGKSVLLTREPGGTGSVIAEKIREIILDKSHKEMEARTELLLFLAARAQHVAEVVSPALEQGKIVLCDRFDGSTFAYQGAARQLDLAEIKNINNWAKQDLEPDLVIYLDISPEEAADRLRGEKHDRLDNERKEFHQAVRAGYLEQAEENKNWVKMSAIGSIEDIFEQIKEEVNKIAGS